VSFGYDEETGRIYFVFVGYREESHKERFGAETGRSSLCVYGSASAEDWRSVVVDGRFERVEDDWEVSRTAIEENAWYPSLFREADLRSNVTVWTLEIESISGPRGSEASAPG
jgi:nitroimidazol reductase NimA-like FMN-containing flavoprotein (pyridoxamine 5'-phosphate oxidase superfamily)